MLCAIQVVQIPYVVEQDEDGAWRASALLRPGVGAVDDGATREEAVTDLRAALLKLLEVGHADKLANDRYTHPLEQAHLAASEQTAALVRKAGKAS